MLIEVFHQLERGMNDGGWHLTVFFNEIFVCPSTQLEHYLLGRSPKSLQHAVLAVATDARVGLDVVDIQVFHIKSYSCQLSGRNGN